MGKQKFRILGAENNSPGTQKALEDSIYLLEQAGALVRTENTQGEPCEPQEAYNKNVVAFVPTPEQQNAIDQIVTIATNVGLEVIGTRPTDR